MTAGTSYCPECGAWPTHAPGCGRRASERFTQAQVYALSTELYGQDAAELYVRHVARALEDAALSAPPVAVQEASTPSDAQVLAALNAQHEANASNLFEWGDWNVERMRAALAAAQGVDQ